LLLIDESYSKLLLFRRTLAENQVSLLQNIERKGATKANSLISLFRDCVVNLFYLSEGRDFLLQDLDHANVYLYVRPLIPTPTLTLWMYWPTFEIRCIYTHAFLMLMWRFRLH